ncbi:hypothetical protein N9M74_00345 [Pontimonas sp.]|nr:hypothetical protein [Pontimonas sp.]
MDEAVWVIAGGPMQVPLVRDLRTEGLKVVVSDGSADCPAGEIADIFVEIDTFDITGHIRVAQELASEVKIRAVLTVAADCHETVSAVSEYLDLPGLPRSISRSLRRKDLFRTELSDSGVLQPKYFISENLEEAQEFVSKMGCDFVLKATDNSGSRGMTFFKTGEVIDQGSFDRARFAGTSGLVLVEEALKPDHSPSEISAETLWIEGEMILLNCVHRLFRDDLEKLGLDSLGLSGRRWGVEIGHINPALLSTSQVEGVRETMEIVGKAFGFDALDFPAILKGDLMHARDRFAVLEATPRLSGGWDSSGTTLLRGGNFQVGFSRLLLGDDLKAVVENDFKFSQPDKFAAAMTVSPSDALDSMNRLFGMGVGMTAHEAIENATASIPKESQL